MPPQHKQHQKQHPRTDENSSPPLLGRHNQGVMVPGDATSASTRIKQQQQQQQQQQQPSSDVAGDRTVEPLIVFDWDDTILTSSWIQVNELLQAGSYDELPLEVRRDLAQLERRCVKYMTILVCLDINPAARKSVGCQAGRAGGAPLLLVQLLCLGPHIETKALPLSLRMPTSLSSSLPYVSRSACGRLMNTGIFSRTKSRTSPHHAHDRRHISTARVEPQGEPLQRATTAERAKPRVSVPPLVTECMLHFALGRAFHFSPVAIPRPCLQLGQTPPSLKPYGI